jgi:hypothetical protein
MSYGWPGTRFIGVEMDSISGRIAKALHPDQDIRIENFRDTRLPEDRIDAVVGNVLFADVKPDYQGQRLSLLDYFFAKSIDALNARRRGGSDRASARGVDAWAPNGHFCNENKDEAGLILGEKSKFSANWRRLI